MKRLLPYLPALVSALALVFFAAAFVCEYGSFKSAIAGWAQGELQSRSALAAATLAESLATDDFRRIRQFAQMCEEDGFSFRVRSREGGIYYSGGVGDGRYVLWGESECEGRVVMVGVPVDRVMRPLRRASTLFALSALAGTAGVLLFFFMTYRQRVRIMELSKLERFRREFIADVSHEIKTPLTGIVAAAELLEEGHDLPRECLVQTLSMIKKESLRLNDLVQDILSLSRLERGAEGGFVFVSADIAALAGESVERFRLRAENAGIKIEFRSGGPCVARCDPLQISRLIDNLVSNALVHSKADTVRISVEKRGGVVALSVEDNGKGIPRESRRRVFERFHRLDASRSESGAGLGLAIVKGVADLHGGVVRVESVEPHGCRFVFQIRIREKSLPGLT